MNKRLTLSSTAASALLLFLAQAASGEIPSYDRVRILSKPKPVSDSELIDRRGDTYRLSELTGEPAMVFFGFTNCPDVCPMAMQKLKQFKQATGDALNVTVVLISVDGERDTPERMDAFLARYSDDFIGLTGKPTVVKSIAKQFSAAFFKENAGNGEQEYSVSHSRQVFLLDRGGRLRAEFYDASVDAMVGVVRAINNEPEID